MCNSFNWFHSSGANFKDQRHGIILSYVMADELSPKYNLLSTSCCDLLNNPVVHYLLNPYWIIMSTINVTFQQTHRRKHHHRKRRRSESESGSHRRTRKRSRVTSVHHRNREKKTKDKVCEKCSSNASIKQFVLTSSGIHKHIFCSFSQMLLKAVKTKVRYWLGSCREGYTSVEYAYFLREWGVGEVWCTKRKIEGGILSH